MFSDHHEGYIDWEVYQRNQTMIAQNDNAKGSAVRGAIKQGEALLAGLLRCGHCGAKLLAQYPSPGAIRYQCSGYLLNRDRACCVMFGGLRADRLVSEQLMQSLAPMGMDAAMVYFWEPGLPRPVRCLTGRFARVPRDSECCYRASCSKS